jgi:penicillin amidase
MRSVLALLLSLAGCTKNPPPPTSTEIPAGGVLVPTLGATAYVRRDAAGVPHLRCATLHDCLVVQGYVDAQDGFAEMDRARRVARGTAAELVGEAALAQDLVWRALLTNQAGVRVEEAWLLHLSSTTRAALADYASGVNTWLIDAQDRAHGAALPPSYAALAPPMDASDVPRWTAQDSLAIAAAAALTQARVQEGRWAALAQDPAARAALAEPSPWHDAVVSGRPLATQRPARAPDWPAVASRIDAEALQGLADVESALGAFPSVHAGHALAMATKAGKGALGAAWQVDAAARLRPLGMDSDDGVDTLGLVRVGLPGFVAARTLGLAYAHVPSGLDEADLYVERDPAGLVHVPVTLHVRAAPDGGLDERAAGFDVVPGHGPLLPGTHLSLRWTGVEGGELIGPQLSLLVATTAADALAAARAARAGAAAFVFVDGAGLTSFAAPSRLPTRAWDLYAAPPWLPLPGDGGAEWGPDVDASLLPSVAPAARPLVVTGFDPSGTGDDGDALNDLAYLGFRADVGYRQHALTAWADDAGTAEPSDLDAVVRDRRTPLGDGLRAGLDGDTAADAGVAAEWAQLQGWDGTCPDEGGACALAAGAWLAFRGGAPRPRGAEAVLCAWRSPVPADCAAQTARALAGARGATQPVALFALAAPGDAFDAAPLLSFAVALDNEAALVHTPDGGAAVPYRRADIAAQTVSLTEFDPLLP